MNSTVTRKPEGWHWGWHGYDNELRAMRGIFLAFGPGRQDLSHSSPKASGADGEAVGKAGAISLWILFMSKASQSPRNVFGWLAFKCFLGLANVAKYFPL